MDEKMINCKTCNTPIAKNAKTCPHCGAANKKPLLKKWWFWAIIVLLVIVGIVASSGDTTTTPSTTNTAATDTANEDQSANEETEIAGAADKYKWISENADTTFTIQEKSLAFINEHPEYFPGNENNEGAISDFVDWEITYAHLSKNISKYGDKLIEISGDVVDIQETADGDITYLHISDYEGKNYILYYLGSLENVFEGNYTWGYALPLDIITFENMENTYTEAVVCAACYVEDYAY